MYLSESKKGSLTLPVLAVGLFISGLLLLVSQFRASVRHKISIHEVKRVVVLTARFNYLYADLYLYSGRRRRIMLDVNDTLDFEKDHLNSFKRTLNDKNIEVLIKTRPETGKSLGKRISLLSICIILIITACNPRSELIKDYDGNQYTVIKIGSQTWMQQNLKTTHYQNGDSIEMLTDSELWAKSLNGALCNYNNDPANTSKYGRLYNWYVTVDNRKVCPDGWRIPDEDDWSILEKHLGGSQKSGAKMKEVGTTNWEFPNLGASNESGFSALPSGFRHQNGSFFLSGKNACFWSATSSGEATAYYRDLDSNDEILGKLNTFKNSGLSIRCIKSN